MPTNMTRAQRAHDSQRDAEHEMPSRRREHEWSSPFSLMRQGIDEMDRWFGRMGMDRSWMSPSSWMSSITGQGDWTPAIEAFTRGNEFVVRAEIPGMSRTDIHVEAGDDTLTIRGERKPPVDVKDGQYRRIERQYGAFVRSFTLPPSVDGARASAEYKHGVLTVKLPLREEAKPRTITVDVAA
jgi:HSP20 family protein